MYQFVEGVGKHSRTTSLSKRWDWFAVWQCESYNCCRMSAFFINSDQGCRKIEASSYKSIFASTDVLLLPSSTTFKERQPAQVRLLLVRQKLMISHVINR